ncbi:hypothetical protein YQE_03553, partial [Dendroctonus ponderosae]
MYVMCERVLFLLHLCHITGYPIPGYEIEDLLFWNMDRLTVEERVKMIKCYYKNGDSAVLYERLGVYEQITVDIIDPQSQLFGTQWTNLKTGLVADLVRPVHHRNIHSADNVALVAQRVEENPNSSIPRRAQHFGLSYGFLVRIVQLDLKLQPEIEEYDLEDMWLQQDGATSYITLAVRALLQDKFPPARSCDFTALDFFLWGYAKDHFYSNNPQTLEQLKADIREVMTKILPIICPKVVENYLKMIEACRRSRGGHLIGPSTTTTAILGSEKILEAEEACPHIIIWRHLKFIRGNFRTKVNTLGRPKISTPDQEKGVLVRVGENPEISTRRLETATGLSKSSVHRIFQQENFHPCHFTPVKNLLEDDFARAVRYYLNQHCTNRWIGRGSSWAWPARSPDFNPLDFCVWGYLKSLVYDQTVGTRDKLINKIMNAAG